MAAKTLTIDGKHVSVDERATILDAAVEAGIYIPTLCHLEGVYDVGACRLCLVEVAGIAKLLPACTTKVSEGHGRPHRYRTAAQIPPHDVGTAPGRAQPRVRGLRGEWPLRVANAGLQPGRGPCRYEYCFPKWEVDDTHPLFGMDHNRCVLCSRCVRVCWHIEGAGTKNVSGRGSRARIITDLNQPWGSLRLVHQMRQVRDVLSYRRAVLQRAARFGEMERDRTKLEFIVTAREKKQWIAD